MKTRTVYAMLEIETQDSTKEIKQALKMLFPNEVRRIVVDVAEATKPKKGAK